MKNLISIKCRKCEKIFEVPKFRELTAKYCSMKCNGSSSKKTFYTNCHICDKNFSFTACRSDKAKYCSRTCYYKAMAKVGTVEKECPICNSKFKTSPSADKTYCSRKCKCIFLLAKRPLESLKGISQIRKAMVARGLIKECQLCGYNSHVNILGVHHKDENRRNNSMDNLIVLCPNCHSLQHKHHIIHGSRRHSCIV